MFLSFNIVFTHPSGHHFVKEIWYGKKHSLCGPHHLRRRHPPWRWQVRGPTHLPTTRKHQGTMVLPRPGRAVRRVRSGHGLPHKPPTTTATERNPLGMATRAYTRPLKNTKKALKSPTTLQPFDPKVKTVVLTDASQLRGIGFALVQAGPDTVRQCVPVPNTILLQHGWAGMLGHRPPYKQVSLAH